jgi:hypothetical protein
MFGARATVVVPAAPPARPSSIQGLRMPITEVVLSLHLPNSGMLIIASSDPTLVTRARFLGASSAPTNWLIFRARETSSGAWKRRAPPAYEST